MALGIPKDQIRYIVDKLHVGESDEKVRALIRMRTAPHPGWTQARVKQAETYALKVHRDNQKMYAYVMGGSVGWRARLKRKNPKRAVRDLRNLQSSSSGRRSRSRSTHQDFYKVWDRLVREGREPKYTGPPRYR